jgi:hypothetical protein
MAIYSYARTSEIEEVETRAQLDEVLEKEALRLHTYALRVGMRVNENVLDQNLLWSVDLAQRPGWQRLVNKLEAGDIVVTCTLERMFSSCEDMTAVVKQLRKCKIHLFVVDLEDECRKLVRCNEVQRDEMEIVRRSKQTPERATESRAGRAGAACGGVKRNAGRPIRASRVKSRSDFMQAARLPPNTSSRPSA